MTERQLRRMSAGHPVILKHEQLLEGGAVEIVFRQKHHHRRMMKNKEMGKGMKIHPHDLDMEGGNIKSFFKKAGKKVVELGKKAVDYGKKAYKEHVYPVLSPLIRENLRPGLKKLMLDALTALETIAEVPEAEVLNEMVVQAAEPAIEWTAKKIEEFGNWSKAYGVGKHGGAMMSIPWDEMPSIKVRHGKKGRGVRKTHPHQYHPSLPPTEVQLHKPMYRT